MISVLVRSRLHYEHIRKLRKLSVSYHFYNENRQSTEAPEEEELYNSPRIRQKHALFAHPVNKPYHGNKKLIEKIRAEREMNLKRQEMEQNDKQDHSDSESSAVERVKF